MGAAFNYWGAIRLRLASHLPVMIGVQVLSTAVMLVLAGALASHGTVWVAAAWGIGHAVGGVAGYLASVTIARFPDNAPVVAGAGARRGAMNRLRNLAVATILRALRVTLRLLSRVVPQSRSVVLAVYPESEGNGLEVARALLERYDGRVVWLRDPRPRPGRGRRPGRRRDGPGPQGQPARPVGLRPRRGGAVHARPLRQPAARPAQADREPVARRRAQGRRAPRTAWAG